jgi:hypothetical protein
MYISGAAAPAQAGPAEDPLEKGWFARRTAHHALSPLAGDEGFDLPPVARLDVFQEPERALRHVAPYCLLHERARPVGFDRVEFDGNVAEVLGARVRPFGRPRWQPPRFNLRRDRDALEGDVGRRRKLDQRLFDLLACIDAGRIKVAER